MRFSRQVFDLIKSIFHHLFIRDTEINMMQDERFIGRCNVPFFLFQPTQFAKSFFPVLKLPKHFNVLILYLQGFFN